MSFSKHFWWCKTSIELWESDTSLSLLIRGSLESGCLIDSNFSSGANQESQNDVVFIGAVTSKQVDAD